MGAPTNYKMAKDPGKSCATCANYNKVISSCNKFVTYVDAGAVCDAWATTGQKAAMAIIKAACDVVLGYRILKAAQANTFAATPAPQQTQPTQEAPTAPSTNDSVAKTQAQEQSNTPENNRLASIGQAPLPKYKPVKTLTGRV